MELETQALQENRTIDISGAIQKYKKQFEDSEAYEVKLDYFEGPIDFLLYLVKQAEIDVKDVFVSEVTSQYLEYMKELDSLDMERATDFLVVASTLLEVKSRMLLPGQYTEEEEQKLEDEKAEIIRRLQEAREKEYKLIMGVSDELKEKEDVNRFYKPEDISVGDVRIVLNEMDLSSMIFAYVNMLSKKKSAEIEKHNKREIAIDKFTVADKIEYIRERIAEAEDGKLVFTELFNSERFIKAEVIATFQAILELLKMRELLAVQNGIYEEIYLVKNEESIESDAR